MPSARAFRFNLFRLLHSVKILSFLTILTAFSNRKRISAAIPIANSRY